MLRTLKSLLLAAGLCALSAATSHAQVDFSITVAPPELRVYDQPPCPVEGYLWTPGYWGYGPEGYYWVDGVWVAPPRVGFLWTPGYWGYGDGFYAFHNGYWGPSVGFYGGVNYGYGYFGRGYGGGSWQGNVFRYNTAVTRVNTAVIRNTYVDNRVNERVTNNRVSFNGRGGLTARPTPEERRAASASHLPPTGEQLARREGASHDRNAFAPNQPRPAAAGRPKLPGGQGGTSRAGREAALANGRAQGEGRQQRDAERQQLRQPQAAAAPQPRGEARQARQREAGFQRAPGASRREAQPQPQRVRPPGGGGRGQQPARAQQAPRQPHEGGSGRNEGKKEEKHQ